MELPLLFRLGTKEKQGRGRSKGGGEEEKEGSPPNLNGK